MYAAEPFALSFRAYVSLSVVCFGMYIFVLWDPCLLVRMWGALPWGLRGYTIINNRTNKPVLIYDLAKEHLVEELKYPPSLMDMEYDPDFAIMVSE